jgi:hypothetical protein
MPVPVAVIESFRFRNEIHERHGKIDILINNAGQYFYPSKDPIEHFRQVKYLPVRYILLSVYTVPYPVCHMKILIPEYR